MSLRVDQIEEAIAARIATVDATPFDQKIAGAPTAAAAFHEAANPLVPQGTSRGLSHLQFWVLADGAPVVADRQRPGDDAKTVSAVLASFLYRIRPGADSSTPPIPYQRSDQRLAARAASAIVRAVKKFPQDEWEASVINSWLPTVSADGEWLLVGVSFSVLYAQPV